MGATQSKQYPRTIHTPIGKFNGIEQRAAETDKPVLHRYLRIPYAKPPVGSLRWRRPQALPPTYIHDNDNTSFGPICPQPEYNHSSCLFEPTEAAPEPLSGQAEDCLYLNIWVPADPPPPSGWPVQVHLHGGWLQVGNACQSNDHDPFDLIQHTTPRIIVSPTYRLNLFGFLAGSHLSESGEDPAAGNYGFWDQRLALEWVFANITHFQGDPSNITVGGLSAGANSTFFQLFYDSHLPQSQRIIKRIYLWSNAVAIQPNTTTSEALTSQFDELCTANSIDASVPPSEKLRQLRQIPSAALVESISRLKMHTFRASTDGDFIPPTFLSSLHTGQFTTLLAKHDISVLLGEVRDEKNLYKLVNPPSSFTAMKNQLCNYYPAVVCDRLLTLYPLPDRETGTADQWAEIFSQIVADVQVHSSLRGFTHVLLNPPHNASSGITALAASNVHRYRICWRANCLDKWFDPAVGVTHSADTPIWWASGWRAGYTDEDKEKTIRFLQPLAQFLYGKEVEWGRKGTDGEGEEKKIRVLDENGLTREDVLDEGLWERGMEIWEALWAVQKDNVSRV